jgi:hypothetical protein
MFNYLIKNIPFNYNIQKTISFQNFFLTIGLGLTNIYYAKLFHLIKICLALPYKFLYYKSKKQQYYMLEVCYYNTLLIGSYLAFDLYLAEYFYINHNIINTLYKITFTFASTIAPLSSFLNKDRFNVTKLHYNTSNLIHLDNGFLYLMIQYNNIINGKILSFTVEDQYYSFITYISWLMLYNIIMYHNLTSKNIKQNNVSIFCYGNLTIYNIFHILFNMINIILIPYIFNNFNYQKNIFIIAYLAVSLFTGF